MTLQKRYWTLIYINESFEKAFQRFLHYFNEVINFKVLKKRTHNQSKCKHINHIQALSKMRQKMTSQTNQTSYALKEKSAFVKLSIWNSWQFDGYEIIQLVTRGSQ